MASSAITPSAGGLRALSHPTRLKMLMLLRLEGPATATQLAQQLKLNTGAASYHLRQLAEHGFIAEDTERGDARDRWWKAAHESTRADLRSRTTEEEAESAEAYLHTVALLYTETLMQHVEERRYLPEQWQDASTISDWHLRLTPKRAEQLTDALAKVIEDWHEEGDDGEDTAGSGYFVVNLNAFPRPGTVVLEGEDE
ncbi:winged helix-turn-helix domain-containing protein [Kribbella kalugense]|uniref:Helix-turn-helix protein n=1 Tax=Kribbella kalugense TaxID=2512221 RepID=A0A4R7ZLI9_9ACTN|nr:helix-turn-helix domain-containing protein [Kribbella kalugense]TDW18687.1 helix-turn-helix protein [Kribbella kalugense]